MKKRKIGFLVTLIHFCCSDEIETSLFNRHHLKGSSLCIERRSTQISYSINPAEKKSFEKQYIVILSFQVNRISTELLQTTSFGQKLF